MRSAGTLIITFLLLLAHGGGACPFFKRKGSEDNGQETSKDAQEATSNLRRLQVQSPTANPTNRPRPTRSPTNVPTANPSLNSTPSPPSGSPTHSPTFAPTSEPTSEPTAESSISQPAVGTSLCVKTGLRAIVSTRAGICSAYSALKQAFPAVVPTDTLARARLFGGAVRLAFHDAGEVDIGDFLDGLGPDGCMAHNGDSDGLTEPTSVVNTVIEPLWQDVCDRISRADFWVLFGKLVVETAASAPVSIAYQYGRVDNVECEGGAGRLPSAQGDLAEISRVFVDQMGLTLNDAVTLLGGHSLGHVHVDVSGYGFTDPTADPTILNAWDDTPASLDNDYFLKLTDIGWKALQTASGTGGQWRHLQDPWVMINVDMAIAFQISTDIPPTRGQRQVCGPRTLPGNNYGCRDPSVTDPPSTWDLCLAYAADNAAFVQAFGAAYTKMTCVGYGVPAQADGAQGTGKLGTLTHIDLNTCPA